MPPPEPLYEKQEVALADLLSTITAGATYWTTPALVTRELLSLEQYQVVDESTGLSVLDRGPVLGVMRSSGSDADLSEHPRGYRNTHRITVWGYVQSTTGVAAGTWLNRLWNDVRLAVAATPDLGLPGTDCYRDGPRFTDDGALEPQALFAQDYVAVAEEADAP